MRSRDGAAGFAGFSPAAGGGAVDHELQAEEFCSCGSGVLWVFGGYDVLVLASSLPRCAVSLLSCSPVELL